MTSPVIDQNVLHSSSSQTITITEKRISRKYQEVRCVSGVSSVTASANMLKLVPHDLVTPSIPEHMTSANFAIFTSAMSK
jgi:23S rRNA maturation-related 3'-5' exoribonuclease YhaM